MEMLRTAEESAILQSLRRAKAYREEGRVEQALKELEQAYAGAVSLNEEFIRNIVLNEKEITEGRTILESRPRGLGITLTNRCNIRCIMCSVWQDPWDIPRKTIDEIFGLLPYLERIFWQGGEAFLSPYFAELLEKISEYPHIRQDLNTNGLLLNQEWASRLIKVNANIIFSIDGVTKKTYEHIRQGARFEDLLKNIKMLNEFVYNARKNEHNRRQCSTIINLVLMKSNYRELPDFIDFAREYKFERLQITPVDIGNEENIFLYRDDGALAYLRSVMPEISRKAEEYGISLSNWLPDLEGSSGACQQNICREEARKELFSYRNSYAAGISNELSCYWPWQFLFMDWGGRVRPQCFCVEPVGNILKNSLLDIWNSSAMQTYRQKLFSNSYEKWCAERCAQKKIPRESLGLDSIYCSGGVDYAG